MIFVLRDERRIGPYSLDELLAAVDEGSVDYEEDCLESSDTRIMKVREMLDWDSPELRKTGDSHRDSRPEDRSPASRSEPDSKPVETEGGPPSDPNALLYAGHPSFLSFPKSLALMALAILGGIYAGDHFGGGWLVAGCLLALLGLSYILFERSMQLYLITPERVELVKGFITKSSNEVRVRDIRAINVRKRGFIGLLGVATVEFASAGSDQIEVAFSNIWAAQEVKLLVRRLQDSQRR